MAQYKVIQDIEADDKLLGPLSLRQFIYAGIAAVLTYLSVLSVTNGAAFILVLLVPPILFCVFFAWPWSSDQPTEVWALARIRFYFKPRKRIWDQSGMKDLVTITVPKKVQKIFTDNLSQTEVRSRLSALADTIDSRGWAAKNANVSLQAAQPTYSQNTSDRLIPTQTMPQPVSDLDIQANDDILDAQNNPIAQQFDQMIQASAATHRQKLVDQMKAPDTPAAAPSTSQPAPDYWFMNQQPDASSGATARPNSNVAQPLAAVAATPSASEAALGAQLLKEHSEQQHKQTMHLKTIQPADAQATATDNVTNAPANQSTPAMTATSDAAILNLANNNDLNVATLARQAKKARDPETPEDEVVISLR